MTAPSAAGTYDYFACVDPVSGESDPWNNCSNAVSVRVIDNSGTGGVNFNLHPANGAPYGITFANDRFYVVDFADLTVYAYTDTGQPNAAAVFALDPANRDPSVITFADGWFYVVDGVEADRNPKVYTYTASGQRYAATDFDLDPINDWPSGITFANGRFYVVDFADLTVYAYTDTGQRDAAFDFPLDPDNDSPTGITVADGWFYVVDNSDDKVYAYTDGPDLVVQNPSPSDSSLTVGESFTLSATVRNQGNRPSVSTILRYYRSSDDAISANYTGVGTDAVGSLLASGSSNESISLTAPSSAGTYYYYACVDPVSGESDPWNNCSNAVPVRVGDISSGPPDLVVENASVSDSSPNAGASFTLSATVRNQGNRPSVSTILRYYRSSDDAISANDTLVGTDAVWGWSLPASGSSNESISLTAPSSAGTYYYYACVDPVSGETARGNNCSNAVSVRVGDIGDPPQSTDRQVLEALYDATGGPGWTTKTNWKTSAPLDEWSGVSTDWAGRVTRLDLRVNGLSGTIPAALGNLTRLERLFLSDNSLTGTIPAALGNMTELFFLGLANNSLTGTVPAALGNMTNLEDLYLHGNRLTGMLPSSLTNLQQLYFFWFHENDGLCAPSSSAFQAWLSGLVSRRGPTCAQ